MANRPKKVTKASVLAKTKVENAAPADGFVLKVDFESFKAQNAIAQNQIIDLLTELNTKTAPAPIAPHMPSHIPMAQTSGGAAHVGNLQSIDADAYSSGFLPIQYQKIFEKYFDPADGFTARLTFPEIDEQGRESGGITFTILVPLKLSNTDDGYQKMYKQDLRTRALQPHNIAKGIDEWCAAVRRNLKYDRKIKTK